MHYIIQENIFRESHYNLLSATFDKFGLPYTTVRLFPFLDKITNIQDIPEQFNDIDDLPDFDIEDKNVFVFGAVKFAHISSKRNWKPGSMMNSNHDFLVYRNFYNDNLLNYDSEIVKYTDHFKWLPKEKKFIRPCADTKAFTGAVFDEHEWRLAVESIIHNGQDRVFKGQPEIQISTVKKIQKEIRFWVVGGKVITGSQYRLGNTTIYDSLYDDDAKIFAQKMVDLFQLNDAFVIDVCLVDGKWKIVECNCINCAGFYLCDIQKLINEIENYFN